MYYKLPKFTVLRMQLLWYLKVMVSFSTFLINPCPSHFPFLLAPDLTCPGYLVIACLFLHFLHSQIWIACSWLSHLCSLPAVSLCMSPFHPALSTIHKFLLQHCEIQNSYLWLRNHSFLEGMAFFLCPSGYSFGQGQLTEKYGRESESVRRSLY